MFSPTSVIFGSHPLSVTQLYRTSLTGSGNLEYHENVEYLSRHSMSPVRAVRLKSMDPITPLYKSILVENRDLYVIIYPYPDTLVTPL